MKCDWSGFSPVSRLKIAQKSKSNMNMWCEKCSPSLYSSDLGRAALRVKIFITFFPFAQSTSVDFVHDFHCRWLISLIKLQFRVCDSHEKLWLQRPPLGDLILIRKRNKKSNHRREEARERRKKVGHMLKTT